MRTSLRRSRARALVTILAAGWVLGACTGDDEPGGASGSGTVLVESEVVGPGADIGDGFTVAEGTVLIGDVLPQARPDSSGELRPGWTADLYVTGDIEEVLERYRRQAERAGVPLRAESGGCESLDEQFVHCHFDGFGGTAERPLRLGIRVDHGTLNGEAVSSVGLSPGHRHRDLCESPAAHGAPILSE